MKTNAIYSKKNDFRFGQLQGTFVLLALGILAGCRPSPAPAPAQVDGEDAVPSFPPTSAEMRAATAPGYTTPPGVKQECFGRLVFDVTQPVEWPVFYGGYAHSLFNRAFSKRVFDPGDEMRFGNTMIAVIGSVDGNAKERVLEDTPAATEIYLKNRIEEQRNYIAKLKKKGFNSGPDVTRAEWAEDGIRSHEKTISENRRDFETFVTGLPNSEGYGSRANETDDETPYSVLRAYLTRGKFIYVFESRLEVLKPADREVHKTDFRNMLAKFRPRAANEIPAELGVCIPFGFIPDDGTTVTEFKQSLRFPDAPGVLYTVATGNLHPRRTKLPLLLAVARAGMNPRGSDEEGKIKPVVTQRIGPHSYRIGALPGSQGGVVLEVKEPGRAKYDMYSIFTGYSGWLGTAVLPYILVDMRTVTKAQAPELTQDPPPFASSMDRLKLLLQSMRLRATNPPMPELAKP